MTQISQSYKTFRQPIETTTLLDDFVPVIIKDIADKVEPIFDLKTTYCQRMTEHCNTLKEFSQFYELTCQLQKSVQQLSSDFKDCEENKDYFTLVFMGAVSAGKTSMICDLLRINPDQLNNLLKSNTQFESGKDDVMIAGEVATANVYEFLIESSHLRLVDVPGTGGVVHDNTTLIPFINKAECVIFLSNAAGDLTNDDYSFILNHVVGLKNKGDLTPETASKKKTIIAVNKWETVNNGLPDDQKQKQWQKKEQWILHGDKEPDKFPGISQLFKRTLKIVPANTSKRFLDEETGVYECYGDPKLDQMLEALKEILTQEGYALKLQRPKEILKDALRDTYDLVENERVKSSVDELVEQLRKLGANISINSPTIMALLESRLSSLENRIKQDLFSQVKYIFESWKPDVSLGDRLKMLYPKQWWGSENFGAKGVQQELKQRWRNELEDLLKNNLKFDNLKRDIQNEMNSINEILAATFRAQLADAQLQSVILKGNMVKSYDGNIDSLQSSQNLQQAVEKAASQIQMSIIDDIIGLVTFDAIIASLIGVLLTPIGSAVFIALRRLWKGQNEKKKAKQELEDAIARITDDVAADVREQVADKLRKTVQDSINNLSQMIQSKSDSLSKPLQALDEAISTVTKLRKKLEEEELNTQQV
ncbi:MAG: hypothetical protein F6J89_15515 [Symploca sp. SIO1C4]|uniref:G domain-containing protein n=1 Tax=Symploca sp. SIO1C4 TaxID=2607765 RepID=A0A6B3NH87_9CYAN|nr:hypothetical protein [Symploca sp. SIO1C4]